MSCTDSTEDSQTSNQNNSNTGVSEWIISKSEIDINRGSLNYNSTKKQTLEVRFTWSPKDENTRSSILDSSYNIDYMHMRTTIIEIQNISKISLNEDYIIPNKNIKVDCIFFGLFSNSEPYKGLKGKIRFNELNDTNSIFKIMLMGELNEMVKFNHDTILNHQIEVLN